MEGMTILSYLLVVVAIIIVCSIAYWLINRSSNSGTTQDSQTQQPTFPAANVSTEDSTTPVDEPTAPAIPKTKGRVWGTLGMLYMAAYALYINFVITGAEVSNLGEAIGKAAAINMFSPFFYCVLAAALLALVGVVGKNKMCILLALAATIGAVFILPGALDMLIIPAVLFLISYIRMAK